LLCTGATGAKSSHRGNGANQQSDTDGLPYHAISYVAVLADPPVHGLPCRWGGSQIGWKIPHHQYAQRRQALLAKEIKKASKHKESAQSVTPERRMLRKRAVT
jgi:hypothetical protein